MEEVKRAIKALKEREMNDGDLLNLEHGIHHKTNQLRAHTLRHAHFEKAEDVIRLHVPTAG